MHQGALVIQHNGRRFDLKKITPKPDYISVSTIQQGDRMSKQSVMKMIEFAVRKQKEPVAVLR